MDPHWEETYIWGLIFCGQRVKTFNITFESVLLSEIHRTMEHAPGISSLTGDPAS